MKIALLAITAAALSSCAKQETPSVPTSDPNVRQVSAEPDGYRVYQHCIDGVLYLTYASKSIVAQTTEAGKPATCRVEK